jgi:hypothetical protein
MVNLTVSKFALYENPTIAKQMCIEGFKSNGPSESFQTTARESHPGWKVGPVTVVLRVRGNNLWAKRPENELPWCRETSKKARYRCPFARGNK